MSSGKAHTHAFQSTTGPDQKKTADKFQNEWGHRPGGPDANLGGPSFPTASGGSQAATRQAQEETIARRRVGRPNRQMRRSANMHGACGTALAIRGARAAHAFKEVQCPACGKL